jgi:hypothetical protein
VKDVMKMEEMMNKIDRTNITEHLIEYQLNMIGKTMEDASKDPEWYSNFTMSKTQADDFKKYSIPLIKKVFKCNRKKAENTFEWFWFEFGLRIE